MTETQKRMAERNGTLSKVYGDLVNQKIRRQYTMSEEIALLRQREEKQEEFEAYICQADHVAWELQEPQAKCYREIVSHFGTSILDKDEKIDRKELGKIVFSNEQELQVLNQIMHPAVKDRIQELIEIERLKDTGLFVLEAALLLEDNYDKVCDEIWYVYTEESVRRARLKENRMYSDEKIDAIMRTQLSDVSFREQCQLVIDNSGEFEDTCYQIRKAMNK